MQGVELARDRKTKEPATEETNRLMDLTKDNGLIVGKEGHLGNVLRIAPPLTCALTEADNAMRLLNLSFSQLA